MKYIVFSFDDGRVDNYTIAFPILQKYSLKGVFNIVSGYLDGTVKTLRPCVTYKMCKEMQEKGNEIALHSNSHIRDISGLDFDICLKKIKKELKINCESYSLAMPYNQTPNESVISFCRKNKIHSICVGRLKRRKRGLNGCLIYFLSKFDKKYAYASNNIPFIQKRHEFNLKNSPLIVNRIGAYRDVEPFHILKLLKICPNNSVVVIMFHSIVENDPSEASWPAGAWTKSKFEMLCREVSRNKHFKNVTMQELFNGKI